jgi:hypothetical protein
MRRVIPLLCVVQGLNDQSESSNRYQNFVPDKELFKWLRRRLLRMIASYKKENEKFELK